MEKTLSMSVAIENRSSVLIKELRSAVADYAHHGKRIAIEVLPSDPLEGHVIGEPEPLTLEAVRRAGIIRKTHRATLGISFVSGYVSTKANVPRLRRSYETIAIAAMAKEGAVGVRFPTNTIPVDLVDSLDKQMERVGAALEQAMTKPHEEEVFEVGQYLVNTLASFTFNSEGEVWFSVH